MHFRTTQTAFDMLIDELFADTSSPQTAQTPRGLSLGGLEATWSLAATAKGHPAPSMAKATRGTSSQGNYGDAAPELSIEPAAILTDLRLHSAMTDEEVTALRRDYALRNHPDRVPAELKDLANQRMMIANDLLDRFLALKRARLPKATRTRSDP